ncbi:MAG: PhoH family protein [Clostridiales bacterium]|nr:PhoH family protein [Clostridiales bacterium]MBR5181872.1 PhoH family protein [Clostridiales bacterium]MBR6488390.1 PhoH family protein [Clostridiales bacterium]
MTEKLDIQAASDSAVGVYWKKIALAFGVGISLDGGGVAIAGDDSLSVLRAKSVLSALSDFAKEGEIDETLPDYLIFLAREGKLEEFLEQGDRVFYTTPSGRPIKAKTLGQRVYIDALERSELVICSGPAGTGKTFLGVAMAVKALKAREVSRIILTRPAIEAGERLGFLPGDIEEKVDPYMRPLYDALSVLLGTESFEKYYDKGLIEVSPLAFMRGRNLDDCFVVLDEAQNTTCEQMKMFLTRIGLNCRAVACGDFTQIDLPRGVESGLKDSINVLRGVEGISIVSMNDSDIIRNSLVQRIVRAYEKAGQNK